MIQLTNPMYGLVKYDNGLTAAMNDTNRVPNGPGTLVADIGTFCKTGINKSRVVAGILAFTLRIKFKIQIDTKGPFGFHSTVCSTSRE